MRQKARKMFGALVILGALCVLATTLALVFTAPSSRAEIARADPAYADRLFKSGTDTFWSRGIPIRVTVVLFEPVPECVRTAVWPLKVLCIAYVISLATFALGLVGVAIS